MTEKILSCFPLGSPWETQDPFLFAVHHNDQFPQGNELLGPKPDLGGRNLGADFSGKNGWSMYHGRKVPGFPHHPHLGFETITVVEQGLVDHTDSLGATGRFGKGDVQWMTAGKGVLHAEMFPLVNPAGPNPLELFQIWLNLPGKSKMVPPNYQMQWSEDIPVVELTDVNGKSTRVKLIAGSLAGQSAIPPPPHSWGADPDNHLAVWLISIPPNGEWFLSGADSGITRALYMYKGATLQIEEQEISNYTGVYLDGSADVKISAGDQRVELLLLQGRPINEPVVQHGPFVMNTRQEIQEAFEKYQKTQFGGWPWPSNEYVHPSDKGRFAIYPDGREEVR